MVVGPVLVVDDDAVSRHVLVQALVGADLAHVAVASGGEAIGAARAARAFAHPARPRDAAPRRLPGAPAAPGARADARRPHRRHDRPRRRRRDRARVRGRGRRLRAQALQPRGARRAHPRSAPAPRRDGQARAEGEGRPGRPRAHAGPRVEPRFPRHPVHRRRSASRRSRRSTACRSSSSASRATSATSSPRRTTSTLRDLPIVLDEVPRDPAGLDAAATRSSSPTRRRTRSSSSSGTTPRAGVQLARDPAHHLRRAPDGGPLPPREAHLRVRRARAVALPHRLERDGDRAPQRARAPVAARPDAAGHRRALRGRAAPADRSSATPTSSRARPTASSSSTTRRASCSPTRRRARSRATTELELRGELFTRILAPEASARASRASAPGSPAASTRRTSTSSSATSTATSSRSAATSTRCSARRGPSSARFRDVTAERAVEAELLKTKNFLQRVIDSSVDAHRQRGHAGAGPPLQPRGRAHLRADGQRDARLERDATSTRRGRRGRSCAQLRAGGGRIEGLHTDVLDGTGEGVPVLLSASLIYDGDAPVGWSASSPICARRCGWRRSCSRRRTRSSPRSGRRSSPSSPAPRRTS